MRIDYQKNPLAIVERFVIPYADGLRIEGRILGITEEGSSDVNWFQGEVVYDNCKEDHPEIGGMHLNSFYQTLKRSVKSIGEVERRLRAWCKSMHLEISDKVVEVSGVRT
ncbi:MAG: hypothetical protein AABX11_00815 [Nanoarchaeota archaeon]